MATRHLYVVIPGIGSVLQAPDGALLWGDSRGTIGRSILKPDRVAIPEDVVPTGLMPTIAALPWKKVAGYDSLVTSMMNELRLVAADIDVAVPGHAAKPNASVLLFPYDFRLSMAIVAERLDTEIKVRRGDRKVIVVAHSMGGLSRAGGGRSSVAT